MMSGTLVSDTFASGLTPFSAIPMSGVRSVQKSAQSPGPTSAMTGTIDARVVQPAAPEAGSQATLERVTHSIREPSLSSRGKSHGAARQA